MIRIIALGVWMALVLGACMLLDYFDAWGLLFGVTIGGGLLMALFGFFVEVCGLWNNKK